MSYELSADSEERRQNAAKVMDILKFIPKSENIMFSNCHYESDGSSELADPFSDDEEDQISAVIKTKVKTSLFKHFKRLFLHTYIHNIYFVNRE